ncbi:MAG: cupredoxin domain-containing protein [Actinomycetota bacterium]
MRRVLRLLPTLVLATIVVAGRGMSSQALAPASGGGDLVSSAPTTPFPDEVHVAVIDFRFTPANVALPRGGTVVFDHMSTTHHSATDATGMLLYDSGSVTESSPPTSYTFEAAGVYPFICTPHPFMGGRVSVPVRVAPATGPVRKPRTVTWATGPAGDGFVYDVQIRRPGSGWTSWRKATVEPSASFLADSGTGTYRFRARLHESGVAASRWSWPASLEVG